MEENINFDSADSDEELQTAIANNLLKPGLNIEVQPAPIVINRKEDMENILKDFRLNLNWIERLDCTGSMTTKEELQKLNGEAEYKSVNNDFQRELCFYKQAQATVLNVMPKLKKNGIPTKRPDDYFAEMAKSDLHMKRIREKLLAQEIGMERSEKAKKLRAARKFGKQVQIEVIKKRAQEKKKMLEEVKKYRKGQKDKIDFLDDIKLEDDEKPNKTSRRSNKSDNQLQPNTKRQSKNERFGFGGKKKWSKSNNAKSFDELSPLESMMLNQSSRRQKQKQKGKPQKQKGNQKKQKGNQKQPRMGKNRRQQNKFRNKNR